MKMDLVLIIFIMNKSCVKQGNMKRIKYADKYVSEINCGPVMYAVMDLEQY